MSSRAALRPFDVPSATGSSPDPTRLLVGRPDARLGEISAAWSNVPTRRRRLPKAPMAGLGLLGAMTGAAAGLAAGHPVLLAGGVVAGGAGGALLVAFVARAFADRRSAYVGAAGYQTSELGLTGVRDEVALFADCALLVSHARRTLVHAGRILDDRDVTTTRLVPRATRGGARAKIVLPALAAATRNAALHAHFAAVSPARFPILAEREGTFTSKGELTLTGDVLQISDGARTQHVGLSDLRVGLRAGFLELAWPGDAARIRFDEIGDGLALLARLERSAVPIAAEEVT